MNEIGQDPTAEYVDSVTLTDADLEAAEILAKLNSDIEQDDQEGNE